MASLDSETLSSRVRRETAEKAVESLLQWRSTKREKPQLFDQEDFLYLVVTLKKIPPKGRTNPYKIPLPHSLHSESSELCLIIDDRTKSNLTKDDARKKIQSENIPISKVIKLSKLKSDYRPFEAKRKLCDSYDMFFADDRVIPLLPSLLGKHFFKKKKIPVPLNLRHKNWKEQIEKGCSSALLYLRTGTCSVVKVAKTSMEVEEIVNNVIAAIDGIAEIVPKKWSNVRSFHLKVLESIALPIYQTVPELKMKIEAALRGKEEEIETEVEDAGKSPTPVKVSSKKESKLSKKKGRIHEVRYMDSNGLELSEEAELDSDLDEDTDDVEISENINKGSGELKGKKRSRVNKVKEELQSELNVEKTLKKSIGVKKKDSVKHKEDITAKKKDSAKQKKDKITAKKKDSAIQKKDEIIAKKKDSAKPKKDEIEITGKKKNGDEESAGKKVKKSGVSKLKAAEGTTVKTKKLKAVK